MEVLCRAKSALPGCRFAASENIPGTGLYLAFEQLEKAIAEGLFAEERKKALPFLPASSAL
jgi:exonuclease VII large subunit